MSKQSLINWCDSSKGFWEGCTFQTEECANCWAFMNDLRFYGGAHWGTNVPRRKVSGAAAEIRSMNLRPWVCDTCGTAWKDGEQPETHSHGGCGRVHRRRVFLNHSSEWLDLTVPPEWRGELFKSIKNAPNCDFILCTKQPENFKAALRETAAAREVPVDVTYWIEQWYDGKPPENVIILFSAGTQEHYDRRLPLALKIPARYHGVSAEPLLSPINFRLNKHASLDRDKTVAEELDWIIVGGESGRGRTCPVCKGSGRTKVSLGYPACRSTEGECLRCQGTGLVHVPRPCFLDWLFEARLQVGSVSPQVPLFIKQAGSLALFMNANFWKFKDEDAITSHPITTKMNLAAGGRLMTSHPKGGDPSEWPECLRVQQFYTEKSCLNQHR